MFQKAYYKLNLLCILLITSILTVMTLIYLFVSEQSLINNVETTFKNDMNVIINNVELRDIYTKEWLNAIESNGKYTIWILDNNIPLWISNPSKNSMKKNLFDEAIQFYVDRYTMMNDHSQTIIYPYHYSFHSSITNQEYYAYFNRFLSDDKPLDIFVLYSKEQTNHQILRQRIIFLLIDLFAIIFLSRFSFIFTKRILQPIEQNQQEQIRFVAAASHELRTPIAVILSSLNACKKADSMEKEGFLSTIESESYRMSKLVNDMLLLAKADNHTWNLQKLPVSLDTVLLNAYEAFTSMAREKNLSMHITLPDEAVADCCCDEDRITQVITILIHNAISYTQNGGTINLSLYITEKYAVISVMDNGPGIPDSEKEKIFERFYRIDNARSKKDHFGLGLCIASEIIHAHQGKIQIKDTPGGGSTFLCKIPF